MSKTVSFLVCLLFCIAAGAQTIRRLDGTTLTPQQADSTIRKLMDTAKVHGMCVSILNGHKPVYAMAYGIKNVRDKSTLDTGTVMYAASFTKAVFACLSMLLIREGRLSLDAPIWKYLKKPIGQYEHFAKLGSDPRFKKITVRMCLSHTTGLPNLQYYPPDTTDHLGIYFEPGSQYAYSGEGLKLLQLAEEEVMGRNIEALAQEKVYGPAGMGMTAFIWQPRFESNISIAHLADGRVQIKSKKTVPGAAGNMLTTIGDYARFVSCLDREGLKDPVMKKMIEPQIRIDSKFQFPTMGQETTIANRAIGLSYGLGVGLLKTPYGKAFFKEGHDDATRNYFIDFYEAGIGIVIMSNSENGEYIFKDLLEKLIGDVYTPYAWQRYWPYEVKVN